MRGGRWWMLGVTCLSVVVVSLDLTILNIALPAISAALHAGTGDLQWIVDAYSLVFASVMLPAGLAGDRFGRKRLLLAGLGVFLAASVWCALSVSAGEQIAARAAMGLGAGIAFPLSLAVVPAEFEDAERPKAIGILTAAVATGLPLGPVLGGLLLQHFSWHSVFWINVPVVCLTLAVGAGLLRESRTPAAPPLDAPGVLLSAGAVTCLVWGVINGPEHGWTSPVTWGLLAGSVLLFVAFLRREHVTAVTQAAQLASRLGGGRGAALQAAAGTAFLHGMSIVMLICAAVNVLAVLTSLRYLPSRAPANAAANARR